MQWKNNDANHKDNDKNTLHVASIPEKNTHIVLNNNNIFCLKLP